ncbi:MAG: Uma2 family endonuclease [Caldilinea sp.]
MIAHIHTLFDTPATARMSASDYIASPQSGQKSDLIEGVFVIASPASRTHELILTFLAGVFGSFVNHRQLGELTGPNAAYRLNEENVYQPDLAFVSFHRLHLAGDIFFDGPPDLVVEIISPSSRQYDTVEKFVNYGRFGVQEYWLIDPIERAVKLFGNVNGQLVEIPTQEGVLRSRLLPGFWLRPEWVFPPAGAARPSELEIARELGLI